MKKLLGLLSIAPMAITACGGGTSGAKYTVQGAVQGSGATMMDNLLNETIDIAGNWGDARRFNGTNRPGNMDKIVAIGVEETRIANDGVQARPDMTAEDIYHVQAMMEAAVNAKIETGQDDEDGEPILALDIYGHESYDPITSTDREVSYLNRGEVAEKNYIDTVPKAGEGEIFKEDGTLKDGETLTIDFIPSTDPADALLASTALQTWLNSKYASSTGGSVISVSVAADYDAAATKLENSNIDLAFLPVNTWAINAPSTQFILQAGRPTQVATLAFDETSKEVTQPDTMTDQRLATDVMNRFSQLYVTQVTNASIAENEAKTEKDEYISDFNVALTTNTDPMHDWAVAVNAAAEKTGTDALRTVSGTYESFIWALEGSEVEKAVNTALDAATSSSWVADIDGMDLKYGYTSLTSSSTLAFPELWLYKHLDATIKFN